jgi:hypothetical protein
MAPVSGFVLLSFPSDVSAILADSASSPAARFYFRVSFPLLFFTFLLLLVHLLYLRIL